MTKIFSILRGGYDKGYKFFIADENLFVCILFIDKKNPIEYIWEKLIR